MTKTEKQEHAAAKYRAVVKNQHTTEKWAHAEKRSRDFVGYS
jgi:hypothetical protein